MQKLSRREFVKVGLATSVALGAMQPKLTAEEKKEWIYKS